MNELATAWRLSDPRRAIHDTPPLSVACTDVGVWRCEVSDGLLLDIAAAEPFDLSDSYARGDDFVATNSPTSGFPFRTQLYWSVKPSKSFDGFALLLTVSLQTDRLDAQPKIDLLLSAEGAEIRRCAAVVSTSQHSVVLTPFASDQPECEVLSADQRATIRFAPPFLEKGVIRRARFAAFVSNDSLGASSVESALAELAAEPLPLTT